MQQFNQPPIPPFMFPPMLGMPPLQPPPKQPDDPEQKSIIDKLASFVARNGPEFENVTKQKQVDNPKFQFLFGGEHQAYYQFKLNFERDLCLSYFLK